jgi:sulfonate dioxygenase
MAPSAVETITVPVVNPTKRHFGVYKELAPTQFDPEAEAGKKGFKGAKVKSPIRLPMLRDCMLTIF